MSSPAWLLWLIETRPRDEYPEGINRSELAAAIGISKTAMSRAIARGPSVRWLERAAEKLHHRGWPDAEVVAGDDENWLRRRE